MSSDTQFDHRRNMRRAHAIWATVVVALATALIVGAASTTQPDGVCSGIGWGCELSGEPLAELVAIIVIPIAFVILLIGHFVISTIGGTSRHRHTKRIATLPSGRGEHAR